MTFSAKYVKSALDVTDSTEVAAIWKPLPNTASISAGDTGGIAESALLLLAVAVDVAVVPTALGATKADDESMEANANSNATTRIVDISKFFMVKF